jgi:very-short-patch-repair endonuclease
VLVGAGFPAPQTQIELGHLGVRIDMGWPEWKVAVEYDGLQHWSDGRQRSWDIERIARLEGDGWIVVRISAEMLSRPHAIIARVGSALAARGCPNTW